MKEVTLAPGWLARDVKRASDRLAEWKATTDRLNAGLSRQGLVWVPGLGFRHEGWNL